MTPTESTDPPELTQPVRRGAGPAPVWPADASLLAALAPWMARRRWYPLKGGSSPEPRDLTLIGDRELAPGVRDLLVAVPRAGAPSVLVHVPLVLETGEALARYRVDGEAPGGEGLTVTGLTTAATLWVVAGVGLAVGAGFYLSAGVTTAIVFLILGNLSRLDAWVDHDHMLSLSIHTVDRPGQIMRISACIEDLHLRARGVKVKTDEDEAETDGERRVYLNFEVYNGEHLKPTFIVDTLRRIETGHPGVSIGNVAQVLRALGILDQVVSAVDPLASDIGRLRAGRLTRKRAR